MAVTIRSAVLDDLPRIAEIYNEAGVATTASYDLEPVTVEDRIAWFERLRSQDFPVLVVESDGVVTGYASYGPFRDKQGYLHTVEHSVYVADGHRSAGAGRMLLGALLDHARGRGVHVMIGVLDADNEASRAFHARMGFQESGVLREVGRKFGRWLDIIFVTHHFR
ncbi:N-acetyltransferase family protein [Arachnia propionica]|uniref:N-acetyltransferase family protein n=1 Tax=Arachnia propionica TaxID=1750 RepID=A0A3P1T924_9ACTN|nr:GNAT family N-acetyltransferase [Arachnia propionica]RRD05788.1 N-acetyltransferase family protein [Arachnia propionica]